MKCSDISMLSLHLSCCYELYFLHNCYIRIELIHLMLDCIEYIPYVIFTDKLICFKYCFFAISTWRVVIYWLVKFIRCQVQFHILNFVSSDFGVGVCIVTENMLTFFWNMCMPLTDVTVFSRGIWTTNDVIYLVISTWVWLSRKVNRGEVQHSAASAN